MKWWPFRHRHKHTWTLISTSITGWKTYKCKVCGREEIG